MKIKLPRKNLLMGALLSLRLTYISVILRYASQKCQGLSMKLLAYPQDCFAYNEFMIRVWQITQRGNQKIDLHDRSSLDAITRQLPDGYYSTFRTYNNRTRILGLNSHFSRLYDPVENPDISASELRRQLVQLLEPFHPDEARVRAIMTKQGQIYIAIEPLRPLPKDVYKNGVRVETTELQRNTPRLKSTAFISTSDNERRHIAQEGIFEALLTRNGQILEGMTSNFFYALRDERRVQTSRRNPQTKRGRVLFTAQRDILLGVTRKTLIRLARGRGVEVKYRALKLNELSDVSEAFITSSSRGVVPVIQIDDSTVGQGTPGQLTRMLMYAYEDYVLKHAEKI
jgi:branched-chain amino acid aminotransferase